MIVEYERTLDDLVEFNLFHIAHSPSLQRQILLWRVFFAFLTVILSLGGIYFLDNDRHLTAFAYILSLIAGVAVFVIYPSLNRASVVRRTRKLLDEGDNKAILGPQTITILPEGLFCKTRVGESTLNWSSIVKVAQDDDYIFVYIGAMNAVVIPKEAFATDEAEQEFLDLIDTNSSSLKNNVAAV